MIQQENIYQHGNVIHFHIIRRGILINSCSYAGCNNPAKK
jgi:hypothetical protein